MSANIGDTPESFRGYVGIAKETGDYGSGGSPAYFIDAISDGFSLDNQPEVQNTTRSRGTHKAEAGPLDDSGSLDLPANPENGLGLLLLAALGTESFNSPSGSVGEHTFAPAEALPSLAIEIDRDTETTRHTGVGVDALELSHTQEEKLTASVDATASAPDPTATSASPTYSDLRNFRFNDAGITLAGSDRTADVSDLTVSIENNLDGLIRNSRTISKMSVGERVVTHTATVDFETEELYHQFLGSANPDGPEPSLATVGVEAEWTSPETVAGGGTNYALKVNSPKCVINTHEANINQDDLIVEDVEFRALVDSGISGEVEVTLTNGVTEAY